MMGGDVPQCLSIHGLIPGTKKEKGMSADTYLHKGSLARQKKRGCLFNLLWVEAGVAVPSPHLIQRSCGCALGSKIFLNPKGVKLFWHPFPSPHLPFQPSFQDAHLHLLSSLPRRAVMRLTHRRGGQCSSVPFSLGRSAFTDSDSRFALKI